MRVFASPLLSIVLVSVLSFDLHAAEAETQLDARRNGKSLVNSSGAFTMRPGDDFELEVQTLDNRGGPSGPQGLFAVYTDILVQNSDKIIPIVGETQIFTVTEEVTRGSIGLSFNSKSTSVTLAQLMSPNQLTTKIEKDLGVGTGNLRIRIETLPRDLKVGITYSTTHIIITFVGDGYVLKDVPDFLVNHSGLSLATGATLATAFKTINIPALKNENGDGKITAREINPEAFKYAIDFRSRSFKDASNQDSPQRFYTNGISGTYSPVAPVLGGYRELFSESGDLREVSRSPNLLTTPSSHQIFHLKRFPCGCAP